jgi:hypothetical protein
MVSAETERFIRAGVACMRFSFESALLSEESVAAQHSLCCCVCVRVYESSVSASAFEGEREDDEDKVDAEVAEDSPLGLLRSSTSATFPHCIHHCSVGLRFGDMVASIFSAGVNTTLPSRTPLHTRTPVSNCVCTWTTRSDPQEQRQRVNERESVCMCVCVCVR